MRVVQVNYGCDPRLKSAAALLDRYTTLTGWSDAIARAGAEVLTVQRFQTSSNVTRGEARYIFGVFSEIAEAMAAFRPDVVHVNGLASPQRTWVLRRWLKPGVAIVVQDHAGGPPRDRGLVASLIRRRFMRAVDAFLFSAIDQAEAWRRSGFISAAQPVYDVMEASTDLRPHPRDEARSASGVTGSPAVLWVGRLNANKDPLTVLDAFERFVARAPGATLTMVYHEADLIEAVRARVLASAPLRDYVRLVGAVPHDRIADFFSAADLFVVGSHHEGSGYAVMEAMACGAIPVVTNIPTFRALTGVGAGSELGRSPLWTPGDAAACARALDEVSTRDLTVERQRVIDHFNRDLTWDAVGKRALAIYRDVAKKREIGSTVAL
jgi:glycosyltransferase involved in cell wall biosynthesis